MSWLKSGLDDLLKLDLANDERYFRAYDDCLWRITTARITELSEVLDSIWNEPYVKLPTPLKCCIARMCLLGESEPGDTSRAVLSTYCTNDEEKRIIDGAI
ncbi:hypothetical protein ACFSJ3_16810 [Corallincola platygyrae]|uniref:Uncharacterized protein n=1 Tax=Corallincola platygyrae TaxID=1193278 RepID=A0ABW4XUT3_9GAMM